MRQTLLAAAAAALTAGAVQAQDLEAGATLAADCAGCHGVAGVSVEEEIPNLAAQKSAYIAAQLTAFRAGDRKNDLMNAIAAQLNDDDIANLSAHFAGLPGAEPGAVGEAGGTLAGAKLAFPADFRDTFQRYHTISFDNRKQVRHYWVDQASLDALSKGEDLGRRLSSGGGHQGQDGRCRGADQGRRRGEAAVFTAMQKSAGWGDEVPEILRNGDWRYAVFDTAGAVKAGTNEGRCLACHKPLDDTDYLFLSDELKAFADSR